MGVAGEMLIHQSHLYQIIILSFILGGLACTAVPAMARDIVRWHRELFVDSRNIKQEEG